MTIDRIYTRRNILRDRRGLALIEFTLVLPVLLTLVFYGVELANYALTRQRVSQLALLVADNASRIGVQEVLRNRPITEAQINDLFTGAALQGGNIALRDRGRVILSGLTVNSSGGQWLQWQRCFGSLAFPSHYGNQGDGSSGTAFKGMGPATNKVVASATAPLVFAELAVTYQPIISSAWAPSLEISEVASFAVRDDRDTSGAGIKNDDKAPISSCSS